MAGSPRLCAARLPAISPGQAMDYSNLDFISEHSQSNATGEKFSFRITFLEQSFYRKLMQKRSFAEAFASKNNLLDDCYAGVRTFKLLMSYSTLS